MSKNIDEEKVYQSLLKHSYRIRDKYTHEDSGYNMTFHYKEAYRELAKIIVKEQKM